MSAGNTDIRLIGEDDKEQFEQKNLNKDLEYKLLDHNAEWTGSAADLKPAMDKYNKGCDNTDFKCWFSSYDFSKPSHSSCHCIFS